MVCIIHMINSCLYWQQIDQGALGQLLMLVIGPGGAGKSILFQAVTETLAHHHQEPALAKCTSSTIAAINIGGRTLHFSVGISIHYPKTVSTWNKWIVEHQKRNILGKTCLIVDKMSMIHDTLLTDIAKVVAHTKKMEDEGDQHLPFAEMHVILMGDFYQFPSILLCTVFPLLNIRPRYSAG